MPVGLVPALLISAIAVYLMYLYHYKPFAANWETEHGGDSLKALMLQPYASEYLTRIAKDALVQKQIGLAFNCAEKALYHYDGELPEWSVLHNFGQIAAVNGALAVAKMSLDQALLINPSAKEVLESLREVHRVIRQIRNENKVSQKMAA
jgi:tetratricopeptide (TPR) repeat protein